MAQSFRPAAIRRFTLSNPLRIAIFAPLALNETNIRETADRFVGELSATIAGHAGVAKLATARVLGARARKSLRVRVPPPAQRCQRVCAAQNRFFVPTSEFHSGAVDNGLDTLFRRILGVQAGSNEVKVGVELVGMDPQRHTGVFVPEHPRQCQHDDFGRCRYARADFSGRTN
jgi:hypothetical protein